MERVHKKFGGKAHVKNVSEWNRLYHDGEKDGASVSWRKRYPHVKVRTAAGYLEEAALVIGYAVRGMSPDKVARRLVPVIGEDAVRRALGDEPGGDEGSA
jgi:hypothetical protein